MSSKVVRSGWEDWGKTRIHGASTRILQWSCIAMLLGFLGEAGLVLAFGVDVSRFCEAAVRQAPDFAGSALAPLWGQVCFHFPLMTALLAACLLAVAISPWLRGWSWLVLPACLPVFLLFPLQLPGTESSSLGGLLVRSVQFATPIFLAWAVSTYRQDRAMLIALRGVLLVSLLARAYFAWELVRFPEAIPASLGVAGDLSMPWARALWMAAGTIDALVALSLALPSIHKAALVHGAVWGLVSITLIAMHRYLGAPGGMFGGVQVFLSWMQWLPLAGVSAAGLLLALQGEGVSRLLMPTRKLNRTANPR